MPFSGLGARKADAIDTVQTSDIEKYRSTLLESKLAKTTVNLKPKILGPPFRVAQKMGYLTVNPFDLIKALSARNTERKAFTLDQLKALLATAQ